MRELKTAIGYYNEYMMTYTGKPIKEIEPATDQLVAMMKRLGWSDSRIVEHLNSIIKGERV